MHPNLNVTFPKTPIKRTSILMVTVLLVAFFSLFGNPENAFAQDASPITVVSSSVESQFPEGMTFKLDAESKLRIDDIRVTFEIGDRGSTQYAYLALDQTYRPLVNGELFHRTNSRDRYIPPGTMIKYWFEITDETGETMLTQPELFRFDDARF